MTNRQVAEISELEQFFSEHDEYYAPKLSEHGASPLGVDWNSDERQRLSFSQLVKLIDGSAPFSVIDFGCGYGALLPFLEETGWTFDYTGVDVLERMIVAAREAHGETSTRRFRQPGEDLQAADYLIACGVLNLKLDVGVGPWTDYCLEMIDRFDKLSRRGFAFNMLTSYSDPEKKRDDLYYGDPRFFFDHCKRNLSPNVAVLHDYGAYEFTMIVRKG
jgi:SAM-dependent methyltransferase